MVKDKKKLEIEGGAKREEITQWVLFIYFLRELITFTKPTLRDNGYESSLDTQKMITEGQTKGISKPYL